MQERSTESVGRPPGQTLEQRYVIDRGALENIESDYESRVAAQEIGRFAALDRANQTHASHIRLPAAQDSSVEEWSGT